jgi:aryl-alcohol dehydrogenase-like predicted oxidoreductase
MGDATLEDTFAAFEELVTAGKILSWGVSNFDVSDLEEASQIAGPGRIACNQVLYHLQERAIEHSVLPWCEQHGVALVGYSLFGHGSFPGLRTVGGRVQQIAAAHNATARQVVEPPGAAAFAVYHPQGLERAACGRERGCRGPALDRSRAGSDRRGLPARPAPARPADALTYSS